MSRLPFTAVVGQDDARLALLLGAVDPGIGGVLLTGEKGTAKTTLVRGLADLLPGIDAVSGCRFACVPGQPDLLCPDGPHGDAGVEHRPARLVELPLGATDDRVVGSLDVPRLLGGASAADAFAPGLLAAAHRGVLYVDEINLLPDHLVDVLLDAAATGATNVERDGLSLQHASQFLLVGTMNPEEGELRPQLLDRFGLCVPVVASTDPRQRAAAVRARLGHDRSPVDTARRHAPDQQALTARITAAHARLPHVVLADDVLERITALCAALGVDGLRGDLVTARTAIAHAAWHGRDVVDETDVRAAARLALPHRQRRTPFDDPGAPGSDLDQAIDQTLGRPEEQGPDDDPDGGAPPPAEEPGQDGPAPAGSSAPPAPARDVVRLQARGVGRGSGGRRSRSAGPHGAPAGSRRTTARPDALLTVRAAVLARPGEPLHVHPDDLRARRRRGRESNLVVLVLDTSGSLAARRRSRAVTTAAVSLLADSYRRRDRVAVVAFREASANVVVPPTRSVDLARRRLTSLPVGGRTPLADALETTRELLRREGWRDPSRRPLVVLVTDGRATGRDALSRARAAAARLTGVSCVVVDAEDGPVRLGLAAELAAILQGTHVRIADLSARTDDRLRAASDALVDVIRKGAA